MAAVAEAGVEGLAEAVAEQVEAEHAGRMKGPLAVEVAECRRAELQHRIRTSGKLLPVNVPASLQHERFVQVRMIPDEAIDQLVNRIRTAQRIPRLRYHFERHGWKFGAATPEEYLELFRGHVRRQDLRVFTYLRLSDRQPFWELIASDSGAAVMYHEKPGRIWSFFLPVSVASRMVGAGTRWVEVVHRRRAGRSWSVGHGRR